MDILPSNYEDKGIKIKFDDNKIDKIYQIDAASSEVIKELDSVNIFPSSHYVVEKLTTERAIKSIQKELKNQINFFKKIGKYDEMKRIEEKDNKRHRELMDIMGFCPGIENYSRHLDQRKAGEPPNTTYRLFS